MPAPGLVVAAGEAFVPPGGMLAPNTTLVVTSLHMVLPQEKHLFHLMEVCSEECAQRLVAARDAPSGTAPSDADSHDSLANGHPVSLSSS